MKKIYRLIVVFLLVAGSVVAHAQSSLLGKWRGMDGNVPNVELTVEQDAGRPAGSAVFYMLIKDSEESAAHVEGRVAGPMEDLKYQPGKLSFAMHRRDGTVMNFRVELIDADHAKLFRNSEHDAESSGFGLTRVE